MATSEGTTRRGLLGAGLGALIATVAGAFGRPSPTAAADGDAVLGGRQNDTTDPTRITRTGSGDFAFSVYCETGSSIAGHSRGSDAVGVYGYSRDGKGVVGQGVLLIGVEGSSSTGRGVVGRTDGGESDGVLGEATRDTSSGVSGMNLATGTQGQLATQTSGVVGTVPAAPGFVGVLAIGLDEATALAVDGRAKFSRSGRAQVPRNRSYVDVLAPGGLDAASLVLAVPMASRAGVFVQAVVPNTTTGMFRVQLNKVASASSTTPIAWFVIN